MWTRVALGVCAGVDGDGGGGGVEGGLSVVSGGVTGCNHCVNYFFDVDDIIKRVKQHRDKSDLFLPGAPADTLYRQLHQTNIKKLIRKKVDR